MYSRWCAYREGTATLPYVRFAVLAYGPAFDALTLLAGSNCLIYPVDAVCLQLMTKFTHDTRRQSRYRTHSR